MKRLAVIGLALGLFVSQASGAAQSSRIGDFALLDQNGKHHKLSWYGDQKAVVIFVQGNGCLIVRNSVPELRAIRDQYAERGVQFFMLNPQPQDTRDSITVEAAELGYDFPILIDETQLIAESLGVDRTSETFIINPETREVIYRGPIDDRLHYETQKSVAQNHYLRDALDAYLAGEALPTDVPEAPGCLINFAARDTHKATPPSYSADIAPILEANCVKCHHVGGIAPWAMTGHAMVQGWSRMMKEVLLTRRMPPGQLDPHVGRPIQEAAGLSPEELQTLVHWIDAGAPGDDGPDPLEALAFSDATFSMGEPDIVLTVPAQDIPATGVIDYRYVPVPLNLDEDIWIRAVEYVPGDRQVLHHVITYLSSPADRTAGLEQDDGGLGESLGGFAPGRQPDIWRDDSGALVRAGSSLLLQMHYTTTGRATVDETQIGIYLHEAPPKFVMSGGAAGQRRFLIPPHVKEYPLEGVQEFERDALLYGLMPHMHYRGKHMKYIAEYPDGTSEILLSVPKYDFNWQFNYQLKEPVFMPAGTRLIARGAMDNSERNPYNPNPNIPVRFGLQTMHEMFFGFTTYRYLDDTPESVVANHNAAESSDTSAL
jgi:peroxiredoxin